jgi:cobalt-precorrin 5A hydrolase
VAGFGFRKAASAESLIDALRQVRGGHGIDALATLADKSESAVFRSFAEQQNLPVVAVGNSALSAIQTATQSSVSQAARKTGSVAEATALSAAGRGASLLRTRVVSSDRMATCALARSTQKGSEA